VEKGKFTEKLSVAGITPSPNGEGWSDFAEASPDER